MRKLASAILAALTLLTFSLAHAADEQKPQAAPGGSVGRTLTMQASVTAIDVEKRMVTLKRDDGQEVTIKVDERARNLPQVKVGDVVKVAYVQELAWKLSKSTKTEPSMEVSEAAGRTKEGDKPGGAAGRKVMITARIDAIDMANGTVTLAGPQGNSRMIKARNPENLKKVKVGDMVDIVYTEAVALKVEPAAKN
jgi:hypothetical protein